MLSNIDYYLFHKIYKYTNKTNKDRILYCKSLNHLIVNKKIHNAMKIKLRY